MDSNHGSLIWKQQLYQLSPTTVRLLQYDSSLFVRYRLSIIIYKSIWNATNPTIDPFVACWVVWQVHKTLFTSIWMVHQKSFLLIDFYSVWHLTLFLLLLWKEQKQKRNVCRSAFLQLHLPVEGEKEREEEGDLTLQKLSQYINLFTQSVASLLCLFHKKKLTGLTFHTTLDICILSLSFLTFSFSLPFLSIF